MSDPPPSGIPAPLVHLPPPSGIPVPLVYLPPGYIPPVLKGPVARHTHPPPRRDLGPGIPPEQNDRHL